MIITNISNRSCFLKMVSDDGESTKQKVIEEFELKSGESKEIEHHLLIPKAGSSHSQYTVKM